MLRALTPLKQLKRKHTSVLHIFYIISCIILQDKNEADCATAIVGFFIGGTSNDNIERNKRRK